MICVGRSVGSKGVANANGVIRQAIKSSKNPEMIKPDTSVITALDIVGKQRRGEILNNYEQKICDRYLSEYYDELGLKYGGSRVIGRNY